MMYIKVFQITQNSAIYLHLLELWAFVGFWWILRVFAFVVFKRVCARPPFLNFPLRMRTARHLDVLPEQLSPNKREQHPCFGNREMQCNRQCKFNQVLADSSSNPVKHWKQSFCQEKFGLQDYHCFPPEASKTSTVTYLYLNILVVCASTGMFFLSIGTGRDMHDICTYSTRS